MLKVGKFDSSYVHRGDRDRRRKRMRAWVVSAGFVGSVMLLYGNRHAEEAQAEPSMFSWARWNESRQLRSDLETAKGDLAIASSQLTRYERMFRLAARYDVPARLAASIYDAAIVERLEPELAFRLVKYESDFKEGATSPVGAIGLTQVMLPTARYFEKAITREKLFDRDVNLRIGFRYLRTLVNQYHDMKLALLVYNRGPGAVDQLRAQGRDPSNGYERVVMRGIRGKGTTD